MKLEITRDEQGRILRLEAESAAEEYQLQAIAKQGGATLGHDLLIAELSRSFIWFRLAEPKPTL